MGIDWADQKHDICLYDPSTQEFEFSVISSQPEAIAAWVDGLRKRFKEAMIAICTEQKRGPLIYALCKYKFLVLYPINAQTVAKYRQAFTSSRAKSDPMDAQLLVELLLKHNDKLQAWQPSSAILRSLQQLVENRRMLVAEKVRLTNRITAALKGYYPQVLKWFEDKDTQIFCEFLTRYPSLKSAQCAPNEELEQFSNRIMWCRQRRFSVDWSKFNRGCIDRGCRHCRTASTPRCSSNCPVAGALTQHYHLRYEDRRVV